MNHPAHMPQRLSLWIAAVLLLWLAAHTTAAQENKWTTTKFTVVYGELPNDDLDRLVDFLFDPIKPVAWTPEQEARARHVEDMLHRYAVEFERMGFREPKLRTHLGRYVVHIWDIPGGTPAIARYCQKSTNFPSALVIDSAVVDGRRAEHHALLDEHLAHELFHTIQYQYNMCVEDKNPGDFFMEGSAQAVGHDMRYRVTGTERSRTSPQRWGTRSYRHPLQRPAKGDRYDTASFWRYVAEHIAHDRRGGRAGVHEYPNIPPDYSYLHRLMLDWKGTSGSEATALAWLDNNLRKETGVGLSPLYAQFLSVYLGFDAQDADDGIGKARYADVRMRPDMQARTLGKCTQLVLTGKAPSAQAYIDIGPMGAACIDVDIRLGPGQTGVVVNARNAVAEQVDQLWVGTTGNLAIGHPILPASPGGNFGGYVGTWNFQLPAKGKQTFLIVNAMDSPWQSRPIEMEMSFTLPTFDHSMLSPELGSQSRRPPTTKTGDGGSRDVVRETAAANLEKITDGSDYTRRTEFVHLDDRNRTCDTPPFLYAACGPATRVNLGLEIGLLPMMIRTQGPGGLYSQQLTAARAFNDSHDGIQGIGGKLLQQQLLLEDQEGYAVELVFPRVAHGFHGTLPAIMHVRGKGDAIYEAIASHASDKDGNHRITGQVVIEEYTPLVMQGSFNGSLVDPSKPIPNTHPTVFPSIGNISGRFSIASQLHERTDGNRHAEERYAASNAMQDIFLSTPGIDPATRTLMQALFDREFSAPSRGQDMDGHGNTSGGVRPDSPLQPFQPCDCTCGQSIVGTCTAICAVRETACQVLAMRPDEASIARVSRWRNGLVAQLDARNTNARLKAFYLSEFDNALDDDARQLLLRSLNVPTDP